MKFRMNSLRQVARSLFTRPVTPIRRASASPSLRCERLEDRVVPTTAGDLDPTFGTGGKVLTNFSSENTNDFGYAVVQQADGKIIAAGPSNGGEFGFALARYNPDGGLDSTFGAGGKLVFNFISTVTAQCQALTVQPDGKIVAAGLTYSGPGGVDFAIARLNPDGSFDTTFDGDGKVTVAFNGNNYDSCTGIAVQADGRIVASGWTQGVGVTDVAVARLNANGSLDTTFDGDGRLTIDFGSTSDYGMALAVQPSDSRILVAGYGAPNGNADFAVARLNTDGSIDSTFGTGGKTVFPFGASSSDRAMGIALQADGCIILAGDTSVPGNVDFAVARLNPNGSLDNAFDGDGKAVVSYLSEDVSRSVAVQSDGAIVLAGSSFQGSASGYDFAVARLTTSGSLDSTFDGDGKQTIDFGSGPDLAWAMTRQNDGRIVVAGYSGQGPQNDLALARLNTNGSLDTSFDGDGRVTTDMGSNYVDMVQMNGVAVQADGKIVVAGYSARTGNSDLSVVRYNPNGSLDTTFGTAGKALFNFGTSDYGSAVAIQPDGKILIVGYISQSGTLGDFAVIRLNPNGTLDTTFDGDGKRTVDFGNRDDTVWGATVQSDGKIVLVGYSNQAGTGYDFAVARLNPDGSLDTPFDGDGRATIDLGTGNDLAYSVVVQTDGKLVLAGHQWTPATGYDFAVVRLNPNGTLDTGFDGDGKQTVDFGSAYDMGYDLDLQPDGKVVIAGSADLTTTRSDLAVARLNPDGTLDTSFDSDGKQTIHLGTAFEYGRAIAVQSDGRLVIAGNRYNNATGEDFAVARLNPNGSVDTSFSGDGWQTIDFGSKQEFCLSMALQTDGDIVLAGSSQQTFTGYDFAVTRVIGNADTTPPNVSQPDLVSASDSGASTTDNITNATALTFEGTAEAGSVVKLWEGTTLLGTTTASAGGTYSFSSSGLTEGNHSIHATATDAAGNTDTTNPLTVLIDRTAPNISHTRTAANTFGWNNTNVTVDFSGADALAGVDTVAGDITLTGEGANQSATGTVTDKAGNSVSYTVTGINIDKTAPTVVIAGYDTSVPGEPLNLTSDPSTDTLSGLDSATRVWMPGGSTGQNYTFTQTAPGIYTVSLAIADRAGNTCTDTHQITVSQAILRNGSLVVGGTQGNDHLIFTPGSGSGTVVARLNGDTLGSFVPTGGRIYGYSMAGDDDIQMSGSLTVSAWLYGGTGNDRVRGGAGADVLLGEDGNDLLIGGDGRDLMIGGMGADRLIGNADDDILIAGYTQHDANVTALGAIQAEWVRTDHTVTERISNIRGTTYNGSNGGESSGYFFKTSGTGATVFDDGAADVLTGGAGADWFLTDGGVLDVITDWSAYEQAYASDIVFLSQYVG